MTRKSCLHSTWTSLKTPYKGRNVFDLASMFDDIYEMYVIFSQVGSCGHMKCGLRM